MSPERKLEAYLVKRCKELGLMTRKVQWIGHNGAPDRVIFAQGGRLTWIELKGLRGKLSVLQRREIDRMLAVGQDVWVAKSIDELEFLLGRLYSPRVSGPYN